MSEFRQVYQTLPEEWRGDAGRRESIRKSKVTSRSSSDSSP
jgi:hypothetical protein